MPQEPQTNVIQMDDFDSSTVERLIQFMYTGDYTVAKDEADQGSGNDPEVKAGKRILVTKRFPG